MEEEMRHLNEARKYSEEKLKILKKEFAKYSNDPICVTTFGSFARREATPLSDLDYIVITENEKLGTEVLAHIPKLLEKNGIRTPSSGGAFGDITKPDAIIEHVGGREDSNDSVTKRLLFLLESECLVGNNIYEEIQDKLIQLYVKDSITEHQICRFLLNDLIRYYRTICVDFEYKTCELSKSWGDRNLKLMFSRKLMFFSGILVVAQTAQSTYSYKRAVLKKFFDLTPIDRIKEICKERADTALKLYSEFICCIGDKKTREVLNNTEMDRSTHTEEFRTHKNKGHHFTWALSKLLTDTFDEAHPIHLALKF